MSHGHLQELMRSYSNISFKDVNMIIKKQKQELQKYFEEEIELNPNPYGINKSFNILKGMISFSKSRSILGYEEFEDYNITRKNNYKSGINTLDNDQKVTIKEDSLIKLKELILSAFICKLKYHEDPEKYNILGYNWVIANLEHDCFQNLPLSSRYNIALAVLEHTKNWKGNYTTRLSEILAIGDRGKPNIVFWLSNSFFYNLFKYKGIKKLNELPEGDITLEDIKRIIKITLSYLNYYYNNIKYPKIYMEHYQEQLTTNKEYLSNLTEAQLLIDLDDSINRLKNMKYYLGENNVD